MRFLRIFAALFIVGVLTTLAGCGTPPVHIAQIPVHPKASLLERGSNPMADTIATSLESSLAERGTVDMQLYSVPDGVRWEEVDGFYTESLSTSDWKPADELRQESAVINTTGWKRGSLASEQGLMVGYAPGTLGNGAFLIVALFSE